jgi:hypothetical protein
MICFSAQRYYSVFKARLSTLLFCLLPFSASLSLSAQTTSELYRGTWQIDTPDDGALILIVKRNARAAYFWANNSDRTVYQGTWSSDESGATLTWTDGSSHRIARDALGFGITHNDATGNERYTAQGQQIPKEVLGQWAQTPSKPDEREAERDKGKGFYGTWQIGTGSQQHFVIIEANRSAASTWNGNDAARGLRGSWAKHGSELHIAWDSGHYSILKQNERDFSYKQIEAGVIIEEDESARLAASRTRQDKIPSTWLASYNSEKERQAGGIAFSSRKQALEFYRGAWIVALDDNSFERIEIGRFGGLSTSKDPSLEGNWRMTGQDIFMRWDDGIRKVLNPIGHGFLIYEYKPGRPLDGVPSRILSATPADATKLAQHLKGREQVAQQMLEMAAAAGVSATPASNNWGQTFMRWAWPFSDDEPAPTTGELLEQGFEQSTDSDPWWWPFWSEQRDAKNSAQNDNAAREGAAPQTNTTPVAESAAAANEEQGEPAKPSSKPNAKQSRKKNWYWPFDL